MYDIHNGKIRNEFNHFLRSENFIPLQKSVFIGNVKSDIFSKIDEWKSIVNLEKDSICICPICQNDFENSYFLGNIRKLNLNKEEFTII